MAYDKRNGYTAGKRRMKRGGGRCRVGGKGGMGKGGIATPGRENLTRVW